MLLGDITLIFTTTYGNVLLVKIGLVVVLLSMAAINKFRIIPSLESRWTPDVTRF